ncbi:MAG: hypothetical protein OSA93_12095 [Akkermansiaceae bacterium]|nr:hypothetical protein [Akkermansiaceae bacterium]
MSKNESLGSSKDAAIMIRRLLFFVLLFSLVFFYLVLTFKGLTSARGMEQAQIGREIARGNNFTTKVIRPAAIKQAEKTESGEVTLDNFYDTYHSPLNPFIYGAVLKAVGGDDFDKYQITEGNRTIYRLDRVIAAVSVICFLIAIGVNYLLISRIFDVRIAGVVALLMALCDLMWKFTHTGLPQMLMLLLFSCALFFSYRALEATIEGKVALGSILVAAIFFALLALSHWLSIWISIGFVLYAAFFFRPKGVAALAVLGILLLFSLYFVGKNLEWTGSPAGTAGLTLYGGLTQSEEGIMRSMDPGDKTTAIIYNMNSLLLNTFRNILLQVDGLYTNLGSIISAPLFFFALLHPFKRASIAQFRWIILLMWITGALGMALFGLSNSAVDSNQLHILFAPIMAAYGLAFLSIIWSRIELPEGGGILRFGHFYLAVIISAGPLLLSIPDGIRSGLLRSEMPKTVWPPYWPPLLNRILHDETDDDAIIITDQPWAVAWYADRHSVWLPKRVEDLVALEKMADDQVLPIGGILVSPTSFKDNPLYTPSAFGSDEEFAPMMLDATASRVTQEGVGPVGNFSKTSPILSGVTRRYPYALELFPGRIVLFSPKPSSNQ